MCQQAAETALAQLRVCKLVTEDALVQLSSCPGSSSDAPALTASSQDVCHLVFSSPEIGHVFYAHSPLKAFPGYSAPLRVLGELRRAAMLLLAEGRSLEVRAFEIDFLRTTRQADDSQSQLAPSPPSLSPVVADTCDVNDVAEAPIPLAMLYRARDICALLDYLSSARVLSSTLSADQLLVLLSERDAHLQRDSVLFSQVQKSMLGVIRQSLINVELEKPACIAHELSELWRPLCPLWLARLREREKELILSVFTASALTQLPELQLEIHAQARAKSSINFSELPGIKDVVAKVKQLVSPDIRGCIPGILHSVVVAAHWAYLGCEKDGGMHAHVLSVCGMGGGLPFAAEASAIDAEHCVDEDAPDHGTARLDFDVLRATISGELSAAQLCALIEHALRANRYAFAALLAHEALTVYNMGMAIPVACVFLGAIAALSAAPPEWVHNELSLCGVQALSQPRSAQSMAEYGALCRRALCCEGAWHASAGAALEDLVVPQTAAALLARFSSALTATAIGTQSATVKLFNGCSTHVLGCSRAYSWDSRSSPTRRLLSTEMTNNKQAVKVCLQLARTQDPPPDFELRADSSRAHLRGGGCSMEGAVGNNGTVDGGCGNGGADGDVIEVSCMQLSDGELHELNMLAFLCSPYFDFFERVGENNVLRVCGANAKGILRKLHKLCSCEALMSGVCFPSDDASTHLKLFMSSMSCGAAAHHLLCVARTEALRSPLIERSPQALDVLRDILRACTLRAVRAGGSSAWAMLTRCRTVVEALLLSVVAVAELQVSLTPQAAHVAKAARAVGTRKGCIGAATRESKLLATTCRAEEGAQAAEQSAKEESERAASAQRRRWQLERAAAEREQEKERAAAADAAAHAKSVRETELAIALSAADVPRAATAPAAPSSAAPHAAGGLEPWKPTGTAGDGREAVAACALGGGAPACDEAGDSSLLCAEPSGGSHARAVTVGSLPGMAGEATEEAAVVGDGAEGSWWEDGRVDGHALSFAVPARAPLGDPFSALAVSPSSPLSQESPPAARYPHGVAIDGGWETITPPPPPQTMPVRLIQFGSFPPISIMPPAHVHARRALAASFDDAVHRAEAVPMVTVAEAVARQVEYYFSAANLAKDRYLRGLMDSEGWVDIAAIASFNRMRRFQLPVDTIAGMLTSSLQLDVDRDEARSAYLVRSRLHWAVFVSPA